MMKKLLNEPIVFKPIFQQRVWGGRSLEKFFGKTLPDDNPYGESWEIVDRAEAQSIIISKELIGKSLHDIWSEPKLKNQIFGKNAPKSRRFPLLFKILDARTTLSLQVHPPLKIAEKLNGEEKNEFWFIFKATKNANLYVGFKEKISKNNFKNALEKNKIEEKIHQLKSKNMSSIFIPCGRIHAIGAGNVIFEIQQNSDTTYRVYDWQRLGLDGKPRQLHIKQSLESINFSDIQPKLIKKSNARLNKNKHFCIYHKKITNFQSLTINKFTIIIVIKNKIKISNRQFKCGDFLLLPENVNENCKTISTNDAFAEILCVNFP